MSDLVRSQIVGFLMRLPVFQMEKRHKQFEYARMVMEKNRLELGSKKPPKFPRETKEENHKRKVVRC